MYKRISLFIYFIIACIVCSLLIYSIINNRVTDTKNRIVSSKQESKEISEINADSLTDALNILKQNAVTYEPLIMDEEVTDSNGEFIDVPKQLWFPDEAYGFVNGVVIDIDNDGADELLALFSYEDNLKVVKYEQNIAENTFNAVTLGTMQPVYECGEIGVILFYNKNLDGYCIGRSDIPIISHCGGSSFTAQMYILEKESEIMSEYAEWDWNSYVHWQEGDRLNKIELEMSEAGWPPMENCWVTVKNKENSSLKYLMQTEVRVVGGEGGPASAIHEFRYMSPNEIVESVSKLDVYARLLFPGLTLGTDLIAVFHSDGTIEAIPNNGGNAEPYLGTYYFDSDVLHIQLDNWGDNTFVKDGDGYISVNKNPINDMGGMEYYYVKLAAAGNIREYFNEHAINRRH